MVFLKIIQSNAPTVGENSSIYPVSSAKGFKTPKDRDVFFTGIKAAHSHPSLSRKERDSVVVAVDEQGIIVEVFKSDFGVAKKII